MAKPDVPMYAILKDSIVIDFGFVEADKIYSILNSEITYELNNKFEVVEMIIENSPAEINMKYDGKKFFY